MTEQKPQDETAKRKILIVEDEVALAQAIEATLDIKGLQTIVAYDGDQALELINDQRPDLILLDVMMPGKSGIEICATLKTDPETASIPVVLVTAKAEDVDRAIGLAAGAERYLTKPFSPTELIALVDETLSGELAESRQRCAEDLSSDSIEQDQLVIYAQELKELFKQERHERKALQKAQSRLKEVDRLKADFLGVVTHELLTPFADIGLALQVLQQQSKDSPPNLQTARDELATKIAELHRLVNGVVKFAELVSKRREPQPGYISLPQLIPSAVQPVAVLAQGRDVDFRVFVPSDLPQIHADPELLSEAVFQMAHNAVKFNLPDGYAQIKIFEYKEWIIIEVKDSGVGLTPGQLNLLGQPFQQGVDAMRRGQEGLGVGWAFTRYFAEIHNGATYVRSPGLNQGSIFYLALPAVKGALKLDEEEINAFEDM